MFFSLAVVVSAMQDRGNVWRRRGSSTGECTPMPHDSCTGKHWTYRVSTDAESQVQSPCADPDGSGFPWCPLKGNGLYTRHDDKWRRCHCAARCAGSALGNMQSISGIGCSGNKNHAATCRVEIDPCDTTRNVKTEGTATCDNGAWTVTTPPSCELKATTPAPTTTPTPTTIPATTPAPITGVTKNVLLTSVVVGGIVTASAVVVVVYYFYYYGAKTTNLDGGRPQREKNYKKKSTHADGYSVKDLGGEGGLGGEDDTAKYVKNLNGEDSEYMEYLISGVSLLAVLLIVGAFYRYFCFRNRSTASGAKE